MSKRDVKVEVEVCDSGNICELAKVEQGYLPERDVAMALVRAVNGVCVQLGLTPPGELFTQASGEVLALRQSVGELTEQSAMITQALAEAGLRGRVSTGMMVTAIKDLHHRGRLASALGPGFAAKLQAAREQYRLARMVGEHADARGDEAVGKPEFTTLSNAAMALGELLYELRQIDPEPVDNGNGTTTHTLTEAVEIGTPEVAP